MLDSALRRAERVEGLVSNTVPILSYPLATPESESSLQSTDTLTHGFFFFEISDMLLVLRWWKTRNRDLRVDLSTFHSSLSQQVDSYPISGVPGSPSCSVTVTPFNVQDTLV